MSEQSCETCKWWSRHERSPGNFRPCRFPLPESAIDYIAELEASIWKQPSINTVLMKLNDGGKHCACWSQFVERAAEQGRPKIGGDSTGDGMANPMKGI